MTNHPNRSRQTNDETVGATDAIGYPLRKIAAELDRCSPELRALIRNALAGANNEAHAVSRQNKEGAAMRLNEANNTLTLESKKRRAAVAKMVVAGNRTP